MGTQVLNPTAALTPITITLEGRAWTLLSGHSAGPLIHDLELARQLDFARPHSIRNLIKRYLGDLGEVFTKPEKPGAAGGRPGVGYSLTEFQALLICGRSDTTKATKILKAMVEVFILARQGKLADAQATAAVSVSGAMEPRISGGDDADTRMLAMMESAVHLQRQAMAQKAELQQLTAQQTELAAQQVALTGKTEQLDAKVTKLLDRPPRAQVDPANRPVAAVKIASELEVTPRTFSLFLRARPAMRALQRPDGRWPLAETVAKYKELIKDASAQLALPGPVVPTEERKSLSKHVRTYCAKLDYNSEQYGDTNNLIYERFKIEHGYDPRDFMSSRLSALDVVQMNGHIPQLFEIVRRLCPLPGDPLTGGGGQ